MARASRRQLVTIAAMRSLTGNASSAARFLNRALICQVRVGFTESASFNPLVTCAFRSFRSAYPEVEVSLEEHPSTELAVALREGRIDAAFLRPPLKTEEGITLHLLEEEDMVVAVPNGHPLAKRKVIDLRELEMETFILYPRSVRPGLADAVVAACARVPSPAGQARSGAARHRSSHQRRVSGRSQIYRVGAKHQRTATGGDIAPTRL